MELDFGVDAQEVETQTDDHVPVEDKDVPVRRLLVISCNNGMEFDAVPEVIELSKYEPFDVVGYIDEPLVFCPGIECREGDNRKGPSYLRKQGTNIFVHAGCGLPTKVWWKAHYGEVVQEFTDSEEISQPDSEGEA